MISTTSIAKVAAAGLLLFTVTSMDARAKTWTVERDGSGDFLVIQAAVDAAASGDTVRIGPGRFDEKSLLVSPGWSDSVRVILKQDELTLIGSGPETIIGQEEPYDPEQGDHMGIAAGDYFGNRVLKVEDLRLENMSIGIYTSYEGDLAFHLGVSNCSLAGNELSMALYSNDGTAGISDCSFEYLGGQSGTHIVAWRHDDLEVRDCTFLLTTSISASHGAIGLESIQQARIQGCQFVEGAGGITVTFGGATVIRDCTFDGQRLFSISPSMYSMVAIYGTTFRNQHRVIPSSTADNEIYMIDSVIEDVDDCSFYITHVGSLTVHRCDLAHGALGAVYMADRTYCVDPLHVDMTDNYWGTDDPDSIRAWIRDRDDTRDACYWVDFEPFLTESTPLEKKSLGSFKAMFR